MSSPTLTHPPADQNASRSPVWWAVLVLLVLPLVLAGLTGCMSSDGPSRAALEQARLCPRAGLMPQADKLAVFDNMQAPSRETVTVKARLAGYNYGCQAVPKKGALEVHLTLSFMAERTALAPDLKGLTLPYFVAVIDSKGNIVDRHRYKTRLVFGDTDTSSADRIAKSPDIAVRDEDIVLMVRGQDAADAQSHRITFGFELVPAQLRYNQGEADLTAASQSTPRKG